MQEKQTGKQFWMGQNCVWENCVQPSLSPFSPTTIFFTEVFLIFKKYIAEECLPLTLNHPFLPSVCPPPAFSIVLQLHLYHQVYSYLQARSDMKGKCKGCCQALLQGTCHLPARNREYVTLWLAIIISSMSSCRQVCRKILYYVPDMWSLQSRFLRD